MHIYDLRTIRQFVKGVRFSAFKLTFKLTTRNYSKKVWKKKKIFTENPQIHCSYLSLLLLENKFAERKSSQTIVFLTLHKETSAEMFLLRSSSSPFVCCENEWCMHDHCNMGKRNANEVCGCVCGCVYVLGGSQITLPLSLSQCCAWDVGADRSGWKMWSLLPSSSFSSSSPTTSLKIAGRKRRQWSWGSICWAASGFNTPTTSTREKESSESHL